MMMDGVSPRWPCTEPGACAAQSRGRKPPVELGWHGQSEAMAVAGATPFTFVQGVPPRWEPPA